MTFFPEGLVIWKRPAVSLQEAGVGAEVGGEGQLLQVLGQFSVTPAKLHLHVFLATLCDKIIYVKEEVMLSVLANESGSSK